MANEWRELFQEFLDKPESELIEFGQSATGYILDTFTKGMDGNEDAAADMFLSLYGMFVAVDGEVTVEELELFNKITGCTWSMDQMVACARASDDTELLDKVNDLIDNADDELKTAVVQLGLVICAIDGEMTVEEQKVLAYLGD